MQIHVVGDSRPLGELNEIKTELKRLDALNVANQSNDR
jgi:hypothetical protein